MKGNSIEKANSKKRPKKKSEEKENKGFKCIHCEKTFYTNQGLKGHITRMHKRKLNDSVENIDTEGDDMKVTTTDTETDEEETLEEKCEIKEVKSKERWSSQGVSGVKNLSEFEISVIAKPQNYGKNMH